MTGETDATYFYKYTASNPTKNITYQFKLTRRKDDAQQFGIVTPKVEQKVPGEIKVYEKGSFSFECLVDTKVGTVFI